MDIFLLIWIFLLGSLCGFIGGIILLYRKSVTPWKERAKEIEQKRRSMSSLYGRITEQFAPFMEEYPFDCKKFRFIGSPIDGIQFEEDEIYFIEFKAAGSVLTPQQKKIKELIERKKVRWHVFEVKNGG